MKTSISKELKNNLINRVDIIYKKSSNNDEKKSLLSRIEKDYNNSDSDWLFIETVEENYKSLIYASDKISSLSNNSNITHIKGDVSTITVWVVIWGIVSVIGLIAMFFSSLLMR